MTRDEMLQEAVRILVETAAPRRIILFGSQARGDASAGSDLDFIVIESRVENRRAEIVRLLEALEPTGIPADIFVASERLYEEWSRVPGNLLHEARREGKIVYEAA
jgi:predicted nucleotidyltransferase